MKKTAISFVALMLLMTETTGASLVEEVAFFSQGVQLSGSLVLPEKGPIHAAVVFVHGSGKQSRNLHSAERFAQAGIAALVYDKRGAGRSGGVYEGEQSVSEKNLVLLADDALAALQVLHKHPKTQALPLGLTGISQAGWIVPLAAEQTKLVDFMVIWSGPVCRVSEEDVYSKYTADLDGDQVPTFYQALQARKSPYHWPDFLGKDSNPSDSLVKLNIPGLWIFGAQDGSVPVDLSVQRLRKLIEAGHSYEFVLFSNLGQNNMTETFSTPTDWIKRLSN